MTWVLIITLVAGSVHIEGRVRSLSFRTEAECRRALDWVRRTTLNEAECRHMETAR